MRGKRSHRARNPRKFEVTKKKVTKKSIKKDKKTQGKSHFLGTFSLLFRHFRVDPQSHFFVTFSFEFSGGFGLCGTFCPSQSRDHPAPSQNSCLHSSPPPQAGKEKAYTTLDIFETPTGPPDPRSPKTPQQQKNKNQKARKRLSPKVNARSPKVNVKYF